MSEQKKNSESRNIRLSDEIWQRVISYADENGMARGAVVESAILKFLDGEDEYRKMLSYSISELREENRVLQRMISATVVAQSITAVTSQKVTAEKFKEEVEKQSEVYLNLSAGMHKVLKKLLR